MAVMDRSEARDHGNSARDQQGRSNTNHLGVSRNSSKISKAMSKKNPIQAPKQQPPVYNIDKNDFRNTVQRLTGSPASSEQQQQQPNPGKPQCSNARLQKIRPPPLSFAAHGPLNPVPIQASSVPNPNANASNPFAAGSPTFFSPLPPLTPGDEVWANVSESPMNTVSARNLARPNNGTNNLMQHQDFASAPPIPTNAWADQTPYNNNANRTSQWNPSPHRSLPRPIPNPSAQFGGLLAPLPSSASQFPGGSQFESPNLQFPASPGDLFRVSPLSSLAGFQSPGSALFFPPSPTARFAAVPSPRAAGALPGFGVPNNIRWLTDSPTAGLTSGFSFPDHTRQM